MRRRRLNTTCAWLLSFQATSLHLSSTSILTGCGWLSLKKSRTQKCQCWTPLPLTFRLDWVQMMPAPNSRDSLQWSIRAFPTASRSQFFFRPKTLLTLTVYSRRPVQPELIPYNASKINLLLYPPPRFFSILLNTPTGARHRVLSYQHNSKQSHLELSLSLLKKKKKNDVRRWRWDTAGAAGGWPGRWGQGSVKTCIHPQREPLSPRGLGVETDKHKVS